MFLTARFRGGVRRHDPSHLFHLFNADGDGGGAPAPAAAAPAAPPPAAPDRPNGYSAEFVRDLREEAKGYRLKAAEQQRLREQAEAAIEQAKKDRDEAIAAAKADHDKALGETRSAADQRIIRAELKAEAVKAGMIDLDGLKLADFDKVKLNPETGEVEGAADLLAEMKKNKPYLFGAPKGTSNTDEPPKPGASEPKHALKMSKEEYEAAKAAQIRAGR